MEIDLDRILDALPLLVWATEPVGHIDFVNQRWSEYTGAGLDEARGMNWQAIIDADDPPRLRERWQSILMDGQALEMGAFIKRDDGQYLWFLVQYRSNHGPMHEAAGFGAKMR